MAHRKPNSAHHSTSRTVRRLTAAEGYLALGLPRLALEELAKIQGAGQHQVPVLWMTGQALKAEGRFDEAIGPLQTAIQTLVGSARERVGQALTECLEQSGRAVPEPGPNPDSEHADENPQTAVHRGRVNIKIPGFGLLKFAATDGAVTIHVEPLPSEPPE
ncbi:MAG: hypothetical protein VB858_06795 [Planctomycetaceae bacterium]